MGPLDIHFMASNSPLPSKTRVLATYTLAFKQWTISPTLPLKPGITCPPAKLGMHSPLTSRLESVVHKSTPSHWPYSEPGKVHIIFSQAWEWARLIMPKFQLSIRPWPGNQASFTYEASGGNDLEWDQPIVNEPISVTADLHVWVFMFSWPGIITFGQAAH